MIISSGGECRGSARGRGRRVRRWGRPDIHGMVLGRDVAVGVSVCGRRMGWTTQYHEYPALDAGYSWCGSATGDGADDEEGLGSGDDLLGQGGVERLVGEVLVAGEEAEEIAAFFGGMVADGAAQHGELEFEGVEGGSERHRQRDVNLDFGARVCQRAEMEWEFDADHGRGRKGEDDLDLDWEEEEDRTNQSGVVWPS